MTDLSDSDIDFDADFADTFVEDMEAELETIQKELLKQNIQEHKQEKEEVSRDAQKLFKAVEEFLSLLTVRKVPYRLVGGRAVTAWLNPNNVGLSREEKEYVKTVDYDVEILGSNSDALEIANEMYKFLVKKLGYKLDKRFENIVVMPFLPGFYVYQIGIPEGSHATEWVVDVHGQTNSNFLEKETVEIEGLRYPNLKILLQDIEQALTDRPHLKGVKRLTRKNLISKAIEDITKLNPYVFNILCKQCGDNGLETFSGFNLPCEELKKMCPKPKMTLEEARKRRIEALMAQ